VLNASAAHIHQALRWALESTVDPSTAAADWLAQDIDPRQPSAIALLTRPDVPLEHLEQAKEVYKTMRVLGETAADRRTGGRLYLAAIAAALVVYRARISRQSGRAVRRALEEMLGDGEAAPALRELAQRALPLVNLDDT
jgi:hypothetical protein